MSTKTRLLSWSGSMLKQDNTMRLKSVIKSPHILENSIVPIRILMRLKMNSLMMEKWTIIPSTNCSKEKTTNGRSSTLRRRRQEAQWKPTLPSKCLHWPRESYPWDSKEELLHSLTTKSIKTLTLPGQCQWRLLSIHKTTSKWFSSGHLRQVNQRSVDRFRTWWGKLKRSSRLDAKSSPNLISLNQNRSLTWANIGLNSLWTSQRRRGKVDAPKMLPVSQSLTKTISTLSLTALVFQIINLKSSLEQQSQTSRSLFSLPKNVKRNAVSRINHIEIKF